MAKKTVNLWDRRDKVHKFNNSYPDKHVGTNVQMTNWSGFWDWALPHVPILYNHSIVTLVERMEANMGGCSW